MYKIGDKVETPHGTGWVRGYSEVYDMYIVDLKGAFKNQQYKPFHLLPYLTALEVNRDGVAIRSHLKMLMAYSHMNGGMKMMIELLYSTLMKK